MENAKGVFVGLTDIFHRNNPIFPRLLFEVGGEDPDIRGLRLGVTGYID
jgi:hypothetical protein